MEAKQIEALESYFKTENEHWNGFTFKMLCEVLQQGQFENLELPFQLFSDAIEIFQKHYKSSLNAMQLFNEEIEKYKLSGNQKSFIYEAVYSYLKGSEFDEDLTQIKELLKNQIKKLKAENQPLKPITINIREALKEMMQKELKQLPDTLKELEPVQRLNILCKLIPFILPKIESIHHEQGERS